MWGTQNLWSRQLLAPPADNVTPGLDFQVDLPMWPFMGQQDEKKMRMSENCHSTQPTDLKSNKQFLLHDKLAKSDGQKRAFESQMQNLYDLRNHF